MALSTSNTKDSTDIWRVASSKTVHPSVYTGDEPLVITIAEGLAAVSVPWDLATSAFPAERAYEMLLSTDLYDAWLIYWPPGTGLDAHDHGGSVGAFAVVSGVLDEETTGADGALVAEQVAAGQSVFFDGDHVHAVVNRGDVGATSVHVYSPPLRTMGFYRSDESGRVVVDRRDVA